MPSERIDIPSPETKRKNGLIKNHKRLKSLAKLEKLERFKFEAQSDSARKHVQRVPSLSPNRDSGDRSKRKSSVTSSETVQDCSPNRKGQRWKHRSDIDGTSTKADTVKDGQMNKKSSLKRPSPDHIGRPSKEDTSCDSVEAHAVPHKGKKALSSSCSYTFSTSR